MWAFPVKEISMDQRDWKLLDKQLRGPNPSRPNDGVTVLMAVAVFFAGMTLGGILFAHESKPMRIASNHTTAAMACDDNGACRIRSHPPAASTLVAL
jgi:hypothetical protein